MEKKIECVEPDTSISVHERGRGAIRLNYRYGNESLFIRMSVLRFVYIKNCAVGRYTYNVECILYMTLY